MGKARRNRGKDNRSDPLGKPVKPPTDPELATLREQKILPIIAKLRDATTITSRAHAASDVAGIVANEKFRKLLLREKIVPIVLKETLTDQSLQSKAAGWSILRNLALEEDADFCVHLYRVDVLAAMEHASQVVSDWLSGKEKPYIMTTKIEKYCIQEICTSLAPLAEELSSARDDIRDAITSRPIILQHLFQLITSPHVGDDAAADALHCLWRMSEDNKDLIEYILCDNETRIYNTLRAVHTDISSPRSVCSTAILHNIYDSMGWCDTNSGPQQESDISNLQVVAKVINGMNVEAALRDRGDRWQRRLSVLQVALEVLSSTATTYLASLEDDRESQGTTKSSAEKPTQHENADEDMSEDEEEEWNGFGTEGDEVMMDGEPGKLEVESEDNASSDDMDMDDVEADMDIVTGQVNDDMPLKLTDLPTLEGLLQIFPVVVQFAMGSWKGEERDPERADSIRAISIEAVNNIAWTVAAFDFREVQNKDILDHWKPLAKMAWEKIVSAVLSSDTDDVGLASMVTSIAWAVSKSVGATVPLGRKEQTRFIGLYKALRNIESTPKGHNTDEIQDPFQHPGVKCIGVVGQLARHPAPLDINREVFAFLLEVSLDNAARPAEMIEALNQLMDIYSDEKKPCQQVFWEDEEGVVERFQQAHTHAKNVLKKVDKRSESELRERGDEAVMNLFRFIKYKSKHRPRPPPGVGT